MNPTTIPNFLVVAPGIFRGGQPIWGDDWEFLKQNGVKRTVKLNTMDEHDESGADVNGIETVYKPINLFSQLVLRYKPVYEDVVAAVNAMEPGTFVHCEHGQDRTGLVVACYRVWKQGWKKEDAEAEMKQHGFHEELLGLTLFWEWAV